MALATKRVPTKDAFPAVMEHISLTPGDSVAHTASSITCNCNSTEFRVLGIRGTESTITLCSARRCGLLQVLQARLIAGTFTRKQTIVRSHGGVINGRWPNGFSRAKTPWENDRRCGASAKSLAKVVGVVDDVREGDLVEPLCPLCITRSSKTRRHLVSYGPHRQARRR